MSHPALRVATTFAIPFFKHRSTRQLEQAIRNDLDVHNSAPKPFVWSKSAETPSVAASRRPVLEKSKPAFRKPQTLTNTKKKSQPAIRVHFQLPEVHSDQFCETRRSHVETRSRNLVADRTDCGGCHCSN